MQMRSLVKCFEMSEIFRINRFLVNSNSESFSLLVQKSCQLNRMKLCRNKYSIYRLVMKVLYLKESRFMENQPFFVHQPLPIHWSTTKLSHSNKTSNMISMIEEQIEGSLHDERII